MMRKTYGLLLFLMCGLMASGCGQREPRVTAQPQVSEQEIQRYQQSQGRGSAQDATAEDGVTTPSGLRYRVIEEGTGRSPGYTSEVTVHYTGWLEDGTVFDSSRRRGQPATFPVSGVIAGWTEGLQLMREGGKMRLVIPPYLGYGQRGQGNTIPPNATLYFEIELISVR